MAARLSANFFPIFKSEHYKAKYKQSVYVISRDEKEAGEEGLPLREIRGRLAGWQPAKKLFSYINHSLQYHRMTLHTYYSLLIIYLSI